MTADMDTDLDGRGYRTIISFFNTFVYSLPQRRIHAIVPWVLGEMFWNVCVHGSMGDVWERSSPHEFVVQVFFALGEAQSFAKRSRGRESKGERECWTESKQASCDSSGAQEESKSLPQERSLSA